MSEGREGLRVTLWRYRGTTDWLIGSPPSVHDTTCEVVKVMPVEEYEEALERGEAIRSLAEELERDPTIGTETGRKLEVERRRTELARGLVGKIEDEIADCRKADAEATENIEWSGIELDRVDEWAKQLRASLDVEESSKSDADSSKLVEFDAWLSFRPEFGEVLTAFRKAFGTDTSAAAGITDDEQAAVDACHGRPEADYWQDPVAALGRIRAVLGALSGPVTVKRQEWFKAVDLCHDIAATVLERRAASVSTLETVGRGERPEPRRCPTCNSPDPKLHPAVQCEGETQPCRDGWHIRGGWKPEPHVLRIWADADKRATGADGSEREALIERVAKALQWTSQKARQTRPSRYIPADEIEAHLTPPTSELHTWHDLSGVDRILWREEAVRVLGDALAGAVPSQPDEQTRGGVAAAIADALNVSGQAALTDREALKAADAAIRAFGGAVPYGGGPSAIELAQAFHEEYERLAPEHGYKTREESAKPWDGVPEDNRNLMVATAEAVLKRYRVDAQPEREDGESWVVAFNDMTRQRDEARAEVERLKAGHAQTLAEGREQLDRLRERLAGERTARHELREELDRLRASKPLSTDVLRNPPDEMRDALLPAWMRDAAHLRTIGDKALFALGLLADHLDEHHSPPSLSERGEDGTAARIEKIADGLERDRREPDKVLCVVEQLRGLALRLPSPAVGLTYEQGWEALEAIRDALTDMPAQGGWRERRDRLEGAVTALEAWLPEGSAPTECDVEGRAATDER